ncbi:hypothetical protein EON68_01495, partial [archaeon]
MFPDAQLSASMLGRKAVHSSRGAGGAPTDRARQQQMVQWYQGTLLELLLAVLASEGRARDFVCESTGFVMSALTSVFASSDRRLFALMRRFIRRMLQLYPQAAPPNRLAHVRFYPWLASCIALRLIASQRADEEMQRIFATRSSEQMDAPSAVRQRVTEETTTLSMIVDRNIAAPGGGSVPEPRASITADVLARFTQAAARLFPTLTYSAAVRRYHQLKDDDGLARESWRNVKELTASAQAAAAAAAADAGRPASGAGAPPTDANILGILRLVRDICRYIPTFLQSLVGLLVPVTLPRLTDEVINAGTLSVPSPAGGSNTRYVVVCHASVSTSAFVAYHQAHEATPEEAASQRAMMLTILQPLLAQYSLNIASQRTLLIISLFRILQRAGHVEVLLGTMRLVRQLFAPTRATSRSPLFVPWHAHMPQTEKMHYIKCMQQALGYPHSPAAVAPNPRTEALGDVMHRLQSDVYDLLLTMCGSSLDAPPSLSQLLHVMHDAEAARHAEQRDKQRSKTPREFSSWLMHTASKVVLPATLSADARVRDATFNVLAVDARLRRARDLHDEAERREQASALHAAKVTAMRSRRRAGLVDDLGVG